MPVETVEKYKCDLCGQADIASTSARSQKGLRGGWVVFEIEDMYLDRSWHKKAICPTCVKKIVKEAQSE